MALSNRIRYPIWSGIPSCVQYNIRVSGKHNQLQYIKSLAVQYTQFMIISYVSEHQLSHIIDASHITPTIRANRDCMLLKLIDWRHCLYFKQVSYIPGTMAQTSGAKLGPTARQSSNRYNKSGNMYNMYNRNKNRNRMGHQSLYGNPVVEPSFGCAIYILGSPKIQTLSPPTIFSVPM